MNVCFSISLQNVFPPFTIVQCFVGSGCLMCSVPEKLRFTDAVYVYTYLWDKYMQSVIAGTTWTHWKLMVLLFRHIQKKLLIVRGTGCCLNWGVLAQILFSEGAFSVLPITKLLKNSRFYVKSCLLNVVTKCFAVFTAKPGYCWERELEFPHQPEQWLNFNFGPTFFTFMHIYFCQWSVSV